MRFSPPIAVLIAALLAIRVAAQPPVEPLATPITATVVDTPLKTWLAELGEQAGVTLRTAPDYEDRAITARVHELPLGRLMNAIAALYEDVWEKRQRGERATYTLIASPRRRALQARLAALEQTIVATELANYAHRIVASGAAKEVLSIYDRSEAEQTERLLAAAQVVLALPPQTLLSLSDGGSESWRLTEVSGPLGEGLRAFHERFGRTTTEPLPHERALTWAQFSVSRPPELGTRDDLPEDISIGWAFFGAGGASGAGLTIGAGDVAQKLNRASVELTARSEQPVLERSRVAPELLSRRISMPRGLSDGRSQSLLRTADAADCNLVADSHTKPPRKLQWDGEIAVEQALEFLAGAYSAFWRVEDGPIVTVRARHWWRDDAMEPPATKIAEWNRLLDENGTLALDQAAEMAALPVAQHRALALRIPEAASTKTPWLHIYGRMTSDQQARARGAGMEWASLAPALRREALNPAWGHGYNMTARLVRLVQDPRTVFRGELGREERAGPATVHLSLGIPDAGRNGMPPLVLRERVELPQRAR